MTISRLLAAGIGPMILLMAEAGAGTGGGGDGAAGTGGAPGGGAPDGGAGGGGAQQAWYEGVDGLDEETRVHYAGKAYGSLAEALKSGTNFEKLARERNVLVKPDATKLTDWDGWKELGWKEKAEDYKIERPKMKDGQEYDAETEAAIVKSAHANKVPLHQTQAIVNDLMASISQRLESENGAVEAFKTQRRTELENQLKTKWGGDYDKNYELAKRATAAFGVKPEHLAAINEAIEGPEVMAIFHKIGEMIGEDRLVTSGGGGGTMGGLTPTMADAQLRQLQSDQEAMAALNDPRHPRHQEIADKRNRLIEAKAKG